MGNMTEQYVVSARKYRPDSFETLIGQDNIARTLKNSIIRGQLAHAYLFCGPRGVGKTSMARIFAKTINCSNPSADMEPCGECESCRSFKEGRSYCIHELDAASNNGVDDIKALLEQVVIPPQVGKYGVYIIDEVHMLSQSAFNAFLKTLEEPPSHAIFILATTEKHKILPTILSRCQVYDFNRITIPDIVRNLKEIAAKESITVEDEALHVIASKADGAMRDALTIFDQTVAFCGQNITYEEVIRNLNVLDYEYSFRLVDAFLAGDYATALLTFDEILTKGFNAMHFLMALSSHLRDLLVSRTGGLDSLLDLPDSLKLRYRLQAEKCPVRFLYDALGITTACEAGYRASANQRLHIEYALMRLSFLVQAPAAQQTSAPQPPVSAARPAQPAAPQPAQPVQTARPAPQPAQPVQSARPADPQPELQAQPESKQPGPEAKPADAPAPARRAARKSASGLSLSAMMEAETEKAAVNTVRADDIIPEDDVVLAAWKKLAEDYASRPRLANAIEKADLRLGMEDGLKLVDFLVENESQRIWIREQLLSELETKLRKALGTGKVKLDVNVAQQKGDREEVLYMAKDKAEYLMQNNTEIRELVKDLELDV